MAKYPPKMAANLTIDALEALLASGLLPTPDKLFADLIDTKNKEGLTWALAKGLKAGKELMRVAKRFAEAKAMDPIHLVPIATIAVFKLCANPIPYFVRGNRPEDFGDIPELPF